MRIWPMAVFKNDEIIPTLNFRRELAQEILENTIGIDV